MLYRVLLLVRFSILLGIVGGLVLVLNAQAQDVLRAFGEEPDWRIVWFVLAAIGSAAVAWWSTRVMFYFRFRGNPASSPRVYPRLKEHLPRLIGASALGLIAVAMLEASLAYPTRSSGPGATLVALGGLFIGLAAAFVYVTRKRRDWFLRSEDDRPRDLRSVRELAPTTWVPLATVAAAGFALMVVFAYGAVDLAPVIGTAAVAMLAVIGLIPVASFLVYLGNRLHLPVVSLLLLWAAFSTYVSDNHYVRVTPEMASDAMPLAVPSNGAGGGDIAVGDYLEDWVAPLQPGAAGSIPVFIVAAEGGGIRAAYWTALVLGELQDRASAEGRDFARHVFAISGVSGGSLGAAAFAALVANDAAKRASDASAGAVSGGNGDGAEQRAAACPGGDSGDTGVRARAERVLQRDFLAPTVAVMLFPDLLQQLVPFGFLNDRAVALERAFEAGWDACEPGRRFARPFSALWSGPDPHAVPLLFLNSTVVETGQRLIEAPVAIREPDFNEAIDGRRALGPEVPLSTAVHNSARFTYVSPAGTVRRRDRAVEVDGRTESEWIRLVDGGYFENSGAVTAAEILRSLREREPALRARGIEIEPVVIHISNDPATTDSSDLLERRKWLNQPVAPVKALLHTRQARGFQAREDLARRSSVHLHFRLCRDPEGGRGQPLPLGWALSALARDEMRRQLGLLPGVAGGAAAARNAANIEAVLALLAGDARPRSDPGDVWACPGAEGGTRSARESAGHGTLVAPPGSSFRLEENPMQRRVSSIAGFALVFLGGGPLGTVAFAQDGSPRLPVGLTLLGADDAPCDGDLMLESGIGDREGLHRVREGQHAVFEVESPNVGWMCLDAESSSDTMECPEETTHVRILRAADDPVVLFECYGVSTRR